MNEHKIDLILKESEGFNTNKNLNQTPKQINSIQELLNVFGQTFDNDSNSFNYNGQFYKINLDNLAQGLGYIKKKDRKND